ncbi:hypothetical protein A3D09_02360 [Candidatus Collierbacteria bacterium RIFCSPHIGHO2_02_FULL_49_10]|uniref:Glycosyltransferase RgtA/B/C/D-like domain-containing protein n=1 Tax=Candidatus Collierbacteria bacterium RIFCSPHIGHO2_02_FULL_49_10 TaxID=1817723 RepID=A0A1F5ER54_9BACT|nr:MAG: hypothetical protein A3D09_02360 [Candidatus Collierbacteria bacterium RIFCSPHIGHO2_02_FULL_49_10]
MAIKKIILLFVVSRLFFLFIAAVSHGFVQTDPGYLGQQVSQGEPSWVWTWANMDGRHFIKIATLGYTGTNFIFFPLYPSLIGLVSFTSHLTPITSGIIISILSTILAVYYLLKLADLDKLKTSKFEVLFLLFFFPYGFILNSVYSDGLFLFFTTTSLYYARKGNWLLSGISALLSSLTRLSGLSLLPILIFEWWAQRRKVGLRGLIAPTLNIVGFLGFAVYMQIVHGNWRLFQISMRAWNMEKTVLLPQVLYRYLHIFVSVSPKLIVYWIAALEFVVFILSFVLALYVYRKIRASYGLFMMILLSLRTFNGTLAGTPRYLIHLFPVYLGLGLLLHNHPRLRFVYYPTTIILGILITSLFVQGYFVG